jgi:hypothetical protein
MIKLNSSLQTKNLLGISDEDLSSCTMDPYYNYLQTEGMLIKLERKGQVLKLESNIGLNVARDYLAVVQVNPKVHELGTVSYSTILDGESSPTLILKGFNITEVELDWLFKIRLMD